MPKRVNPELKITGLKRLPVGYNGEPCVLTIIIGDQEGGMYESEIHMDGGYDAKKLMDACAVSFAACDAQPISCNIQSFRIKK